VEVIEKSDALREQLADWRHAGEHVALVPTMGNLHDGHISLIELARENAERVVVSVFVNPTQFGEGEDFEDYPRTIEVDRRRARKSGVDLLFVPSVETVYPFGVDNATSVSVPTLSDELCGSFRPGHFDGVTTVVTRLFSLVQPDVAVFGQKDYQQHIVIRRLVDDLNLPINVLCGPTRRELDGLAMSSRNQYLSDDERLVAPQLHEILHEVGTALENGQRSYGELEAQASKRLEEAGFTPEYVSVRRAENLKKPNRDCDELVVLASCFLGKTRLIDNLVVHI